MFTHSFLATGSDLTGNIIVLAVIAAVLVFALKIAGRMILKWAEFCSKHIKNHPKICSAAIFSPPVIVAALMAYMITVEANNHIAGYPILTFFVWFLPIAVGALFWFGIAASSASD